MKPSEKMANELHSEHCNFERYGTKCTCGTQALVDEVSQLEEENASLMGRKNTAYEECSYLTLQSNRLRAENAALRAELMSLKGAYYSANNKGWQLEFDNAALKEETERLRDGMRDVRKHIALMHTAYDILLLLLAQEKGEDDE